MNDELSFTGQGCLSSTHHASSATIQVRKDGTGHSGSQINLEINSFTEVTARPLSMQLVTYLKENQS